MDTRRAREIMNSDDHFEVLYRGAPVWLENLKNDTAEVLMIDIKKKLEVPIKELIENIHEIK